MIVNTAAIDAVGGLVFERFFSEGRKIWSGIGPNLPAEHSFYHSAYRVGRPSMLTLFLSRRYCSSASGPFFSPHSNRVDR